MDKGKGNKNGWIRCESKSRRGRFYLFNKATGETQWLPSERNGEATQRNNKLSVTRVSKTPAQDRLKRLQHSLKLCQTSIRTSNTKPKTSTEQANVDVEPSTSCSAKSEPKSSTEDKKKYQSVSLAKEEEDKPARHSTEGNENRLSLPDSMPVNSKNTIRSGPSAIDVCKENSSLQVENNDSLVNVEANSLSNICSGIVKKIRQICKMPFSATGKIFEKPRSKAGDPLSLANTSKFKTTAKTKSKQILSSSVTQDAIINQIKEERKKPPESKAFSCLLSKSTPRSPNIPPYPKGSANLRLERLKESLLHQQQPNSSKCSPDDSSGPTNIVSETNDNEVESMDWQPITTEKGQSDAADFSPTVVEKSKRFLLNSTPGDEDKTIGDIIDTVNENLLRFSAEKQKRTTNNEKWRKDFYYFVLDTNVLLKDLTFIEDLTKMKLCGTRGSLSYVPYAVLQELDRLKMRSGAQEGVKTLAVRAIKYLNGKFENNTIHLQAQSALEERLHLIDVNSADDSIINCCLQVKNNIRNVLFLTEDVNLRNKAISNSIPVSTKSDLLAKRYSSNDIS